MMYYRRTIVQTAALSSAFLFRFGAAAAGGSGDRDFEEGSLIFEGSCSVSDVSSLTESSTFSRSTKSATPPPQNAEAPTGGRRKAARRPSQDLRRLEFVEPQRRGAKPAQRRPRTMKANPLSASREFQALSPEMQEKIKKYLDDRYVFKSGINLDVEDPTAPITLSEKHEKEVLRMLTELRENKMMTQSDYVRLYNMREWDFKVLVRAQKVHQDHIGQVLPWGECPVRYTNREDLSNLNRIEDYLRAWETGKCGGKILAKAEAPGFVTSTCEYVAECCGAKSKMHSFTDCWKALKNDVKREVFEYCRTGIISFASHPQSTDQLTSDVLNQFREQAFEKIFSHNRNGCSMEDWLNFSPNRRMTWMCWTSSCDLVQASQFEKILSEQEIRDHDIDFELEEEVNNCCTKCCTDFIDRLWFNTAK